MADANDETQQLNPDATTAPDPAVEPHRVFAAGQDEVTDIITTPAGLGAPAGGTPGADPFNNTTTVIPTVEPTSVIPTLEPTVVIPNPESTAVLPGQGRTTEVPVPQSWTPSGTPGAGYHGGYPPQTGYQYPGPDPRLASQYPAAYQTPGGYQYPGSSPQGQYPNQGQYQSQGQYPSQGQYQSQGQYPNQGHYPYQGQYPSQRQYPYQGQYPSQGQYAGAYPYAGPYQYAGHQQPGSYPGATGGPPLALTGGQPPSPQPPRRQRRGLLAVTAFLVLAMLGWASFTWATTPWSGGTLTPGESTSEPTTQPTRRSRPELPQSQPSQSTDQSSGQSTRGSRVTAAMSAGVVLISADTGTGTAAGTGMVIASSGRVLTNYHVVAGSESVSVTIADSGDTYSATVVGFDQARDVALLQLKGASGLATVTFDDDTLAVGDTVSAVGNANGGGSLVRASGSVTDLSQDLTVSSDSPWGSTEDLQGLIETTAGAVPGDSGGPMFDSEAEVVGITTAGSTRTRTSYAVPITEALSVVSQIESGQEAGTVRIGPAGYLGIRVAESGRRSSGVTVTEVTADGPAAKAGMTSGSVLTRVGDTKITASTNVAQVIRGLEPGAQVTIAWIDPKGRSKSATVTLGTSPVN